MTAQEETKTCIGSQPMVYWDKGGKYGPFAVQDTGEWAGWPDFGQVMRYFRKKAKLSAAAFGILYGEETNDDKSPVGARWIHEMEHQNRIPVDITKRKTIARLLKIPPMLFGLASLEDLVFDTTPYPQALFVAGTGATKIHRTTVDLAPYRAHNHTLWHIHSTSNAYGAISQLKADIHTLEGYEQQVQGDLLYSIQEMLLSNQILATHIVRDQRQFHQAYIHANETVRVAREMNDHDLLAAALFTRGWTRLEWGSFGQTKQGIFDLQIDKIEAAVRDFQRALALFPEQQKEQMHPQLQGILTMELQRSQALLARHQGQKIPSGIFLTMDNIAETVDKQHIEDQDARVLMKGDRGSWNQASYMCTRATVLNAAGFPGQALRELSTLEALTEKTYSRDETRRFAWLDILKTTIFLALGEYGAATETLKGALLTCKDINSTTNIAIVTDIYARLQKSPYQTSKNVQEIGELLETPSLLLGEPEEA